MSIGSRARPAPRGVGPDAILYIRGGRVTPVYTFDATIVYVPATETLCRTRHDPGNLR